MTHYGIDFTPVNELAHLPVRLQPQMEIYKDNHELGGPPVHPRCSKCSGKSIGRSAITAAPPAGIGVARNYGKHCGMLKKVGRSWSCGNRRKIR